MTVLALNISALYLGTGVGGAPGGIVLDMTGARWIPLASAILLTAALALMPRRDPTSTESDPSAQDKPYQLHTADSE